MDQPATIDLLTSSGRIRRGFTRIGIGAAVVTILVGVPVTVMSARNAANNEIERYQQAQCLMKKLDAGTAIKNEYDKETVDVNRTGCPGYSFYSPRVVEIYAAALRPRPNSTGIISENTTSGLFFTASIAAALFFLFGGIGWIVAGFTRDPE